MARSRFFLKAASWQEGGTVCLSGDEAHHCARVLRHREGDEVELFDGAGGVAVARIVALRRDEVDLAIETVTRQPPLPHRVHLLPALIKGEAFEWLLEKAVELGAATIQPVLTANTVARWDAGQGAKKLAKWRRHMLEAAKQCHTPFLPELRAPAPLTAALRDSAGLGESLRLVPALFGQTQSLRSRLAEWAERPRQALILIGPEGDFTEAELTEASAAGFQPVTLGPLILRAETAVVASLAVVAQSWLDETGTAGQNPAGA